MAPLGGRLGLSLGRAGRVLVMQSWLMEIRHRDVHPAVHPDAYVAPTAVLSGEVRVGPGSCVLHGAVLTADGGPVDVGANCVIMEHAVLRGTARHSLVIGDHVLAGPHSYLTGCRVGDETRCCPDISQRRDHDPTPNSLSRPGPSCPTAEFTGGL